MAATPKVTTKQTQARAQPGSAGNTAASKSPAKKATAKKTTAGAAAAKGRKSASSLGATDLPYKITPEKAMANTRELLADKQGRDRQSPAWQEQGASGQGRAAKSGFQSSQAKDKAVELHAGESRLNAIEGSISDQDRRDQAKRDNR